MTNSHAERRRLGMRRLLLGIALGTPMASAAFAADLGPVDVAPPVMFTWSGFYLGANIGGGWSTIQDNGLGGGTASSVMGGVAAGYNWQFAPAWLVGIEADGSAADLTVPAGSGDVNFVASVRGRLGYSPDPDHARLRHRRRRLERRQHHRRRYPARHPEQERMGRRRRRRMGAVGQQLVGPRRIPHLPLHRRPARRRPRQRPHHQRGTRRRGLQVLTAPRQRIAARLGRHAREGRTTPHHACE